MRTSCTLLAAAVIASASTGCCTEFECSTHQYGNTVAINLEYCGEDEADAEAQCEDEQNGPEGCGLDGGCDVSCSCSEPD